MPSVNRTTLKGYFNFGDVPTESNFVDLIDSAVNQAEDNLTKEANGPLRIGYGASSDALQKVIEFYRGAVSSGAGVWGVGLISNTRPGLAFFQGTSPRLFISDGGNVGIGTDNPTARLHVEGNLTVTGATNLGADTTVQGKLTATNVDIISALTVSRLGIGPSTSKSFHVRKNAANDWIALIENINPGGGIVQLAHGGGYGAHIDAGTNASANTYALDVVSNNVSRLFVRGNGNVGIGTTTPEAPLSFAPTLGPKIALFPDAPGYPHSFYGFEIQGGQLQIKTTEESSNVVFGYEGRTGGFRETMRVRGNGNVGIGTNEPAHALHVHKDATEEWLALFRNGNSEVHLGRPNHGVHINAGANASQDIKTYALRVISNKNICFEVKNNGNVGIGYDERERTPRAKLDIWGGDLNVTGNSLNGTAIVTTKDGTAYFANNLFDNGISIAPNGDVGIVANNLPQGTTKLTINSGFTNSLGTGHGLVEIAKRVYAGNFLYNVSKFHHELQVLGGTVSHLSDFSELFESENKITIPIGTSVIFTENGHIRPALDNEAPMGVVSAAPAFIGNEYDEWPGKYKRNEFGQPLTEEKEVETINSEGKTVIEKHHVPQMNPNFDPSREYIPRRFRPEWHPVGLLGQLHLRKGQPVAPTWVKIRDVSENVELWLVK